VARAFVAVRPPDAALAAVADAVAPVRDGDPAVAGARWTTPAQWHVTLQFLGNRVDLDGVATALAALDAAAGTARLGGGGAFPSPKRARVLWLGLLEGTELLASLATAVGTLLGPVGYPPEGRPFHAHLTLARLARAVDVRPAVDGLGTGPVGEAWRVGEVLLYESVTRRDGATYREHAAFPLR
jgi:2'-5' RNA ligase